MIVKNNRILTATEGELYDRWVAREIYYQFTFREYVKAMEKKGVKVTSERECPNCGGELIYESGCCHCPDCGWSACDN